VIKALYTLYNVEFEVKYVCEAEMSSQGYSDFLWLELYLVSKKCRTGGQ